MWHTFLIVLGTAHTLTFAQGPLQPILYLMMSDRQSTGDSDKFGVVLVLSAMLDFVLVLVPLTKIHMSFSDIKSFLCFTFCLSLRQQNRKTFSLSLSPYACIFVLS